MNYFNYFTEIEETFVRRRGKNLLLSPLDWALIEAWQERGIPLHVVLRAVENVFDGVERQPARKRTIKSLAYCKEEVEAQYAEWLERQVGKNGNVQAAKETENSVFSAKAVSEHLENIAAELKDAMQRAETGLRETLERVLIRLAELKENFASAELLEDSLEKLDCLIDESLLENRKTDHLKSEIEMSLASYKNRMEAEAYEKTFDLMLRKRLREETGIPRLSLFYL